MPRTTTTGEILRAAPDASRGAGRLDGCYALEHVGVHVEVGVDRLDVVVVLEPLDQPHERADLPLLDGSAGGGPHHELGRLELNARGLQGRADAGELSRAGHDLPEVAVQRDVLRARVDRGEQVVL